MIFLARTEIRLLKLSIDLSQLAAQLGKLFVGHDVKFDTYREGRRENRFSYRGTATGNLSAFSAVALLLFRSFRI
jgi:hypothetical protein